MKDQHTSVLKENYVVIPILIKMIINLRVVTTTITTTTTTLTEGKKFTTWIT
jgi:hypothetical protein